MLNIAAPKPRSSWLVTLGWAAYLGCSWTWCIGMFLPILLMRDYGIWGFVVFALPNVLGAGAMGWVLRRQGASERIVDRHQAACAAFSLVTIAFQVCFMAWALNSMFERAAGGASPLLIVPLFVVPLIMACFSIESRWPYTIAAIGTWLYSIGLAIWLLTRGELMLGLPGPSLFATDQLVWLAPVCAMGFALCPYLDRTFLQARMYSKGPAGTTAFILGFGVLFFAMILFTLGYANIFGGTRILPTLATASALATIIITAHIVSQAMYTICVHMGVWKEHLRPANPPRSIVIPRKSLIAVPLALTIIAFAFICLRIDSWKITYAGLSGFELLYRLFMSFYGLAFPAYVWLCMIPARGETTTQKPTRQKLAVLATVCLLAAPCYWMGFIERETVWLMPGLGLVLMARLMVRPSQILPTSPTAVIASS